MNILYMPKVMSGRGMRSIEQTYKETRIKSPIKMLCSNDLRVQVAASFNSVCMKKKRVTIFGTDAIRYANGSPLIYVLCVLTCLPALRT